MPHTFPLSQCCSCRPLPRPRRLQHCQPRSLGGSSHARCALGQHFDQQGSIAGACWHAAAALLLSLSLHGSPLSAAELPHISPDAPVVTATPGHTGSAARGMHAAMQLAAGYIRCMVTLCAAGPGAAGAIRAAG